MRNAQYWFEFAVAGDYPNNGLKNLYFHLYHLLCHQLWNITSNSDNGALTDATKILLEFYFDKVWNLYQISFIITGDVGVALFKRRNDVYNLDMISTPLINFVKARVYSLKLQIKLNKDIDAFTNRYMSYNRQSQRVETFSAIKHNLREQLQCLQLLNDNIGDYKINEANDGRTNNILNINTRKQKCYQLWKNLTMLKKCQYCDKNGTDLRKCKGCRKVFYRSTLCQKKDWNLKHHKNICHK